MSGFGIDTTQMIRCDGAATGWYLASVTQAEDHRGGWIRCKGVRDVEYTSVVWVRLFDDMEIFEVGRSGGMGGIGFGDAREDLSASGSGLRFGGLEGWAVAGGCGGRGRLHRFSLADGEEG